MSGSAVGEFFQVNARMADSERGIVARGRGCEEMASSPSSPISTKKEFQNEFEEEGSRGRGRGEEQFVLPAKPEKVNLLDTLALDMLGDRSEARLQLYTTECAVS